MFLHSCGVTPYRTNYYDDDGGAYNDNDVDGHGSGGGAMNNHNNDVDDGDDVDDYNDSDDEGTGLGVGFELGLGLGLGVNWGGAGGVGSVCYEMGQRNVAMCFAVNGKRDKQNIGGKDQGGNNNRGMGSKENDKKGNIHKKGDTHTSQPTKLSYYPFLMSTYTPSQVPSQIPSQIGRRGVPLTTVSRAFLSRDSF